MKRRIEIVRVYTIAHTCELKVEEFTSKMEEILIEHGGYCIEGKMQWWFDDFEKYKEAIETLRKEGAKKYKSN